jgi:hypothetical protein
LALYDKGQAGVTRPPQPAHAVSQKGKEFALYGTDGSRLSFGAIRATSDAALELIRKLESTEAIYEFWKRNRTPFAELMRAAPNGAVLMETIISVLKARAKFLGDAMAKRGDPIKQGTLTIPKEKRVRNKLHLRFVGPTRRYGVGYRCQPRAVCFIGICTRRPGWQSVRVRARDDVRGPTPGPREMAYNDASFRRLLHVERTPHCIKLESSQI